MNKNLNYCLLLILLSVFTIASAQQNSNTQHTPRTSVTVSTDNQPFWLFIDDVLQNDNATSSIRVDGIPEGQHYLRVELDNAQHHTIGQYVDLQHNRNAYWVENQRNLFGLSADRGTPKPETVVFFKYMQQSQPHNPYDHNYHNGDHHGNYPPHIPQHNYPEQNTPSPAPNPNSETLAMPNYNFQQALELVKKESFENSKLTIAKQILDNNMLNISQIKQLCALFDFDKTRLEFVQSAYPRCTEKENYYLLNSAFEYNSTKTEFDRFLRTQK